MGVENNECVIATTTDTRAMQKIKDWVMTLSTNEQSLFAFLPGLINSKQTVVMGPDGSKKGWDTSKRGEVLRDQLVAIFVKQDYEDGSNPFYWIEVGYGEFGQKVLRGNGVNMYGDEPYAN